MQKRPKQIEMTYRTWGGKRLGAGRPPKGRRSGVSHDRREALASRFPVHVTLRVRDGLESLRKRSNFRVIHDSLVAGCNKPGFRLTQFSVQRNHLHMVCEAADTTSLSRGMQGLTIRVARALNRQLGRTGKLFADRFHSRILRTPREVRNALRYVMHNGRSHARRKMQAHPLDRMDLCSSAAWFDGWRAQPSRRALATGPPPVAEPHTWLLHTGWRRHGLIEP